MTKRERNAELGRKLRRSSPSQAEQDGLDQSEPR